MSNLIITIISIALVAIAALMAAWYGGSAFSNGAVTAQANTMIAQAEQIASAIRLWSSDNGGQQTASIANGSGSCRINGSPFETLLINGKYLQSTPGQAFHSGLCGTSYHNYVPGSWAISPDGNCTASTPLKVIVATFGNDAYLQTNCDFPVSTVDQSKICDAINKTQGVTTPPVINSWGSLATAVGSYPYICEKNTGFNIYFFVYKVL